VLRPENGSAKKTPVANDWMSTILDGGAAPEVALPQAIPVAKAAPASANADQVKSGWQRLPRWARLALAVPVVVAGLWQIVAGVRTIARPTESASKPAESKEPSRAA
jgi:hypothetical protein